MTHHPYRYGEEWVFIRHEPIVGDEGITVPGHFISFLHNTSDGRLVFHVKSVVYHKDGQVAYVTVFIGNEYLVKHEDGTYSLAISTGPSSPPVE